MVLKNRQSILLLVGYFIFSPFSKLRKLGSAYDGILATESKFIIFFYYDVISMWHRAFETPIGRKFRDFPNSKTVGAKRSILVSNCAERSISYTLASDFFTLSSSKIAKYCKN